jgi:hypothetical protein
MSTLEEFRRAKDTFFASHAQSPLLPEQQDGFEGLTYYDEDPDLVFEVKLDMFDAQDVVFLSTTGGTEQSYTRWGSFTVDIDGEEVTFTVFAAQGAGGFFLPFKDATSGEETYGGGRYVDVEALPGERYRVDFNKAYNPYCAYNTRWSCTIPPAENHVEVAIEAGEKAFSAGE